MISFRISVTGLAFAALAACGGHHPSKLSDGPSRDASADARKGSADASLGAPITAPSETWTWVPFDDAYCGNGSSVGIGVNLTTASSNVLIYLEGGGGCWSELTCYTIMSAAYFTTGYGEADFTTESTSTTYLAAPGGFFDRTSSANPFQNYSYIYVPYCTGDWHEGNAPSVTYGAHTAMHVGFANMTAFLRRIVPTFPSASRVVIAGSSAGGFGATYNFAQTQQAFGGTRVDLIDDSGIFLGSGVNMNDATQRTQWNLTATTPSGCTGCATSFDALVPLYATTYPSHRFAMLSYTQDTVIPTADGITTAQFTSALDAEAAANFGAAPIKYFFDSAMGHVLFFQPTLAVNSVTEQQWLTQMVTDDAAWASEHP